jgi:hypothetical protein
VDASAPAPLLPPLPLLNAPLALPEEDAPELEPMMRAPELEPEDVPELAPAPPPSSPAVLPEKPLLGGSVCGLRLHPAARATPLRTLETRRRRRGAASAESNDFMN